MTALHDDEFAIDDDLVSGLVATQFPRWADHALRPLATAGTVNRIYRLGDDKLVRLPRAPNLVDGPEREARWMPIFASHTPLVVPRFLGLGQPTERYPSHWTVLEWIDGAVATPAALHDRHDAAGALGEFVVALRQVPIDGAPSGGNYRGFGLAAADTGLRRWAARLPADIDATAVTRIWDSCLEVGERTAPPTWLHSDLRGDNLIARDGRLVAVIDWEGCTVGDPSADLLAAWWLFDADSRVTFRRAAHAESGDWQRAKGWALHMAVLAIPYYADTNPIFVGQARRALQEIVDDD